MNKNKIRTKKKEQKIYMYKCEQKIHSFKLKNNGTQALRNKKILIV